VIELKARLYDIGERLKELELERVELLKETRQKVFDLNLDSFLSIAKGKAEDLKAKVERFIKNIEETEDLIKESQEIKNKLEVLK
jgi:hypothetical protein